MDVDASKTAATRVCYNCGKPGHIARSCPSPKRAVNVRQLASDLGFGYEEFQEAIAAGLDAAEIETAIEQADGHEGSTQGLSLSDF
jgi:hypothetical protein